MNRSSWIATGAILLTGSLEAQDHLRTPTLTALGKERYRAVADVRERTNGDVLVADPEEQALWMVNANGERKNAAKGGSAGAPGRMINIGGDSMVYFNRMASAFSMLTSDGKVVDAPSLFTVPQGPTRLGRTTDGYTADVRGRLYWLDNIIASSGANLKRRDSNSRVSDIAALRNPVTSTVRQGGVSMTRTLPFSGADDWAVNDSGVLAVVRIDPYRVEVTNAHGTKIGAVRNVPAVPTTDDDRKSIARSRQKAMNSINLNGMSFGGSVGDDSLPPTKAIFARNATRVAPDGTVMVHRTVSATSNAALVDVFTADGNYRETLSLPKGARIVGFGAQRVFVSVQENEEAPVTLHTYPR